MSGNLVNKYVQPSGFYEVPPDTGSAITGTTINGGYAVKMYNRTGASTFKGQLLRASASYENAVEAAPLNAGSIIISDAEGMKFTTMACIRTVAHPVKLVGHGWTWFIWSPGYGEPVERIE